MTTAITAPSPTPPADEPVLKRTIGFWGLMFVSLGSIIGSGWLMGSMKAAHVAGGASLLSWAIAAVIITVLALVHSELGAAYPVAGGTARFPGFAFGALVGFIAGWAAYLQAVTIAPIEVEAVLPYMNTMGWVREHFNMINDNGTLNTRGLVVASLLMAVFTAMNLFGAKFLSESNMVIVVWKTAVPILTIIVLLLLSFHMSNFTAGGGFAPAGTHGIFAALPAGVVFSLQGFEQAVQLGGEAERPQRDISRAVITATAIGAVIYILLEVAFIGAQNPADLLGGFPSPDSAGHAGPFVAIATALGATWLAWSLYADAAISPSGTGLVYVGTSSRLSYALGKADMLPRALGKVDRKGLPVVSIVVAFLLGELMFAPFPSWGALIGLVSVATVLMYAFAPVTLAALRVADSARVRPYRLPAARILAPAGFVFANLIVYWAGSDTLILIMLALAFGLVLFFVNRAVVGKSSTTARDGLPNLNVRASLWVWAWFAGLIVIGLLGQFNSGSAPLYGWTWMLNHSVIPEWWDYALVTLFSLGIFSWGVRSVRSAEEIASSVALERIELEIDPELSLVPSAKP